MKNFKLLYVVALAMLFGSALSIMSCNSVSAENIKENRGIKAFSGIDLSISADVYLTQGDKTELIIEGDKTDLEKIETYVKADELIIKCNNCWGFKNISRVSIYLTSPNIKKIVVTGSGDVIAKELVKSDIVRMIVTGSGSVVFNNLKTKEVKVNISGSGDVKIDGKNEISNSDIVITGSGDYNAENIISKSADINITGSGSCKLNVSNEIEANITGSGKIYYVGKPIIDVSITGSGKIIGLK